MPNLIQSQVPLIPILDDGQCNTKLGLESFMKTKNAKFEVDTKVLVHPYSDRALSLVAQRYSYTLSQSCFPSYLFKLGFS